MGADPRSLTDMVQLLNGFRPGTWRGGYVIVHRAETDDWAVAQLTTDREQPFACVNGECYPTEAQARAAIARMPQGDSTARGRR